MIEENYKEDSLNLLGGEDVTLYVSSPTKAPNKYTKQLKGVEVDVYDVLIAFGVTCPARQHAIKKLLMAGNRGSKGTITDLKESIDSTKRAIELESIYYAKA